MVLEHLPLRAVDVGQSRRDQGQGEYVLAEDAVFRQGVFHGEVAGVSDDHGELLGGGAVRRGLSGRQRSAEQQRSRSAELLTFGS